MKPPSTRADAGQVCKEFWTDDRVVRSVELLALHDTVDGACLAMSAEFGRRVTGFNVAHAYKARQLNTPKSYLRAKVKREFRIARSSDSAAEQADVADTMPAPPLDEIPVDLAEDWHEVMPVGHRLKGNSTLIGPDGEVDKRWVKTERDSDDPPELERVPLDFTITDVSTAVDGQSKVRYQWTKAKKDEATRFEQFWSACKRASESYRGLTEPVRYEETPDDQLMVVYGLGDPHIGLLSWGRETGQSFDLKVAERELIGVVDRLVARAPAAKKSLLVNVGDYFHADDETQLTPGHGNKLDVDGRWAKVAEVGFNIMRRLVDRMLTKHETVEVHNAPGNHDPQMAVMLAMWMRAVFEREPRVSIVDNVAPRTYVHFGKNLIGITHGNETKDAALPGIMAAEKPEEWGATKYRLWLSGHIHHETRKEYTGATVDHLRTIAAKDAWHNGKGYMSLQSLAAYVFDYEFGEVDKMTEPLRRFRAVMAQETA